MASIETTCFSGFDSEGVASLFKPSSRVSVRSTSSLITSAKQRVNSHVGTGDSVYSEALTHVFHAVVFSRRCHVHRDFFVNFAEPEMVRRMAGNGDRLVRDCVVQSAA